jgi:hypothetical protein
MLKPLKSEDRRKLVFSTVDIETNEDGTYLLGAIYTGDDYLEFSTSSELANYIVDHGAVYYAHCGVRFDYALLFNELVTISKTCTVSMSGSSGVYMTVDKSELLDSYRLLPASLEKLTMMFCPERAKIKLDCMPWDLSDVELREYLRRDCESLYLVVERFYDIIKTRFGQLYAKTLPALAMKIYRYKYQQHDMWGATNSLYTFEKLSYFGGMMYVKPGLYDGVYSYDINSMYPWAMQGDFPITYHGKWVKQFELDRISIYRVVFKTHGIPYIYSIEDRKLVNEGVGIVCNTTIKYGLSRGDSFTLEEGYVYFRTADIFSTFVNDLYSLRLASQAPLNYVIKILLNSLYGKFGQRRESRTISTEPPNEIVGKSRVYEYGGREVFDYVEDKIIQHSMPIIASLITMKARLRLHSFTDSNTIYMDTDSIHSASRRDDIPISNRLGDFKEEVSGVRAVYLGKKLYQIGEVKKAKGIPSHAMSVVSMETMYSPRTFEFDTFPSIVQQLRRDVEFKKEVVTRTINHTLVQPETD